jgi:hypothetical protein
MLRRCDERTVQNRRPAILSTSCTSSMSLSARFAPRQDIQRVYCAGVNEHVHSTCMPARFRSDWCATPQCCTVKAVRQCSPQSLAAHAKPVSTDHRTALVPTSRTHWQRHGLLAASGSLHCFHIVRGRLLTWKTITHSVLRSCRDGSTLNLGAHQPQRLANSSGSEQTVVSDPQDK